VSASVNDEVSAEAHLIVVEEEHERILKRYEAGEKDQAKEDISHLSQKLSTINRTLEDTRIAKKVEQLTLESGDMEKADRTAAQRQSYLKSSKQRVFYAKKGKRAKYMMKKGDRGFDVKKLQKRLRADNLYSGATDGVYDDTLKAAVARFQKENDMEVDGVAGPATLRKLNLY